MTDAGFSLPDGAEALYTIYAYTIGFVIEEQAIYPKPGQRSEQYDIDQRSERMAHENVPLATEAGHAMFAADHNTRYQRGLNAIITGIGTWLS
jgi:TetR/AcrR family tetracycline transcriptional repressor